MRYITYSYIKRLVNGSAKLTVLYQREVTTYRLFSSIPRYLRHVSCVLNLCQTLLEFHLEGMAENAFWQNNARTAIASKSKLPEIDIAEIQCVAPSRYSHGVQMTDLKFRRGQPHKSKDPKEHISVTLLDKEGKKVTSMHVYADGSGTCSKQKYN